MSSPAAVLTRPSSPVLDGEDAAVCAARAEVVGIEAPSTRSHGAAAPGDAAVRVSRPVRAGAPSGRRKAYVALIWAAAVVAGWLLYRQVSQVDLGAVLASAQWGWVLAAAGCFALALGGSALNVIACSPVRLRAARTYGVQVACGFVRFISPTAVGGAALNARYVRQAGVSTPVALASVGAAQVIQVATTVGLLAVLAPVTGTSAVPPQVRGQLGWAAVGVVTVAAIVLAVVPAMRALLARAMGSIAAQVRQVGATPASTLRRLVLAAVGAVLLTIGLVLALTASVAAMGGVVAPVPIGVAFLVGSALGSAVPTPGGIGTVEAALVAALVASGQLIAVALPAVLLFRLLTVWLQVPLGWLAFQALQRRGHV